MSTISISLDGIEAVTQALNYRPGSPKYKAFMAIKVHYTSEDAVTSLGRIPTSTLVDTIWNLGGNPSKIKSKTRNFSSLKSAINTDLAKLSSRGGNPENITISPTNIFDMTEAAKNELLNSFSDAVKTSDLDLHQASDVLKAVTEFLDELQEKAEPGNDTGDIVQQIRSILEKIKNTPEEDPDAPPFETVELEEDEELEIIDGDELKGEGTGQGEAEDQLEEVELDEDEELEIIDPEELEEIEDGDDIEEVELAPNEEMDTLEPDEDLGILEEEPDLDEVELEEVDPDETVEELDPDMEEELEADAFQEDDLVEELDEDEDELDLEVLDEDEEILEEVDEDEELEILDPEEDLEEIDELTEEEQQALDEFRKQQTQADEFDNSLSEADRRYNSYVKIPQGIYTVGTTKNLKNTMDFEPFEMPKVYMGRYPVTNALFEIFVEATGYVTTAEKAGKGTVFHSRYKRGETGAHWQKTAGSRQVQGAFWYQPGGPGTSLYGKRHHPVVQVSVEDAVAYAGWIGRRLPTEAEWEAAARTDQGHTYPWGEAFHIRALNIEESALADTTPVDEYDVHANAFGLTDILGNVMEWTMDTQDPPFGTRSKPPYCVAKGGGWNAASRLTIATRALFKPGFTANTVGFRCISEYF